MSSDSEAAFGCVTILVVCAVIGIGSVVAYNHQETHEFTVSGKDRVCSGGEKSSCWYEVYGTEGEVFKNEDSLLAGKWDSASVHARFKVGARYRVTTTGWRVPFLSMRPNIIRLEPVT